MPSSQIIVLIDATEMVYVREFTTSCMLMRASKKRKWESIFSTFRDMFAHAKKTLLEKLAANATLGFTDLSVTHVLETQQTTHCVEWEEYAMMDLKGLGNVCALILKMTQNFSVRV